MAADASWSELVCLRILLVTTGRPAKTAEWIEIPLAAWTRGAQGTMYCIEVHVRGSDAALCQPISLEELQFSSVHLHSPRPLSRNRGRGPTSKGKGREGKGGKGRELKGEEKR